jgi:hypothetical protein
MITKSDSCNTIEFDKFYVIHPHEPNWKIREYTQRFNSKYIGEIQDDFEYNSKNNLKFLKTEELRGLIAETNLY